MKRIIMILFAVGMLVHQAQAQWVVEDPALLAQTILNTYLAKDQFAAIQLIISRSGDPASIENVAGAEFLLKAIGGASCISQGELQTQSTGSASFAEQENGVFRPIADHFRAPDGTMVARAPKRYRPFDAIDRTASNWQSVFEETEPQLAAVEESIRATTKQVQIAQTAAEVEKLQVVAASQGAALNLVNTRRDAALTTALLQDIQNRADTAKQTEARNEERSVDFRAASDQFGKFLTPVGSPVIIPSARR